MASDTPHKQEFRIRDLSTRSVVLFPTRAQIIRDIKDITLLPGLNQIVVDGLAPTVDEHSIKVEGTGAATITEVTVDLLPNREIFEDIYPSDSEDEDEDDEDDESEPEPEDLQKVTDKIHQLNLELLEQKEKINSAANRLQICDNYGKSIAKGPPHPENLKDVLKSYTDERGKIFQDHTTSSAAAEKIQEDISKSEKEKTKLAKSMVKAREKVEKEKAKLKAKKLRQEAEIQKEKQRVKAERSSFWPKKVYRISITVETSTMTPESSRRSSMDSDTMVNLSSITFHEPSTKPLKSGEISISISYITYSASWSPRYDLSLNTLKSGGVLEYGAELKNTTSETWRDAKVILSTSQTSFSGLSKTIPTLPPWHVRLIKTGGNTDGALFSTHEIATKRLEQNSNMVQAHKSRQGLFGVDSNIFNEYAKQAQMQDKMAKSEESERNLRYVRKAQALQSLQAPQAPQAFASGFAAPNQQSLFGGSGGMIPGNQNSEARGVFGNQQTAPSTASHVEKSDSYDMYEEDLYRGEANPSLVFAEGSWEESGMTTTYDVPGVKTLAPSDSTLKHKIAKVDFKNIVFSHVIVGKLCDVAFLKARIRNSSKITLLKGPLGLTLDGSFLGQVTFPRCSPGETFSLPLGVDPSISVNYLKPTVRRSQSGIFSKEDSNVFTRSMIITNTKHNAAVQIMVLDQVPVSEDERLKIEITNPRGLKTGGDTITTGTKARGDPPVGKISGSSSASNARASVYGQAEKEVAGNDEKWGSASATAKKGGEVSWNVKLNPGQAVRLVLEYEATFPGGESVVGA